MENSNIFLLVPSHFHFLSHTHTHMLFHRINVVFAFATFAKRFLAPFPFYLARTTFSSLAYLSHSSLFPLPLHKPKCLTLALSQRSSQLHIYTNPSLASRSHFLLSLHFVVVAVAVAFFPSVFVCFSCCYKKLIRIVNFVFIRQTDSRYRRQQQTLKHTLTVALR